MYIHSMLVFVGVRSRREIIIQLFIQGRLVNVVQVVHMMRRKPIIGVPRGRDPKICCRKIERGHRRYRASFN
jgi:hypothetical protein